MEIDLIKTQFLKIGFLTFKSIFYKKVLENSSPPENFKKMDFSIYQDKKKNVLSDKYFIILNTYVSGIASSAGIR